MAFLLNKTALSALRFNSQKSNDSMALSRRGFHVEPGTREKALLAEDSSLKRFKSHKQGVRRLKVVGDILTIVVVAGCCYEIYDRAVRREEARKKAT
ncbi:succinate dehydrogenase subunit 7A, mitochondrial-like [Salvia hispanica]|uniref:succinate dehydrogenase subunit 7A, mitochondrial-like n=1 Tax=Salvia hispanica TaxID=49212 RepID=UPI002009DB3D|nr:succinate dehydrogenase subunit 7A, mitochondrial-like [Salvia hispanica]